MAVDGIDHDSVETASLEDDWINDLPDLRADPDDIEAWELPDVDPEQLGPKESGVHDIEVADIAPR